MMKKLSLIEPSKEYKNSFYQMADDYHHHNELDYPKYFEFQKDTFNDYLLKLDKLKSGQELPQRHVTTVTYWLVDDNKNILGTIRYRDKLTETTRIDGGHIGFDVPPSVRSKGHATRMLRLLIDKLKDCRDAKANYPEGEMVQPVKRTL